MVAADARTAITFMLSPGHAHDAPQARQLLLQLSRPSEPTPIIMDRAYEGSETRELVMNLGFTPVVPPKENRRNPWDYDRELYRRRNEVERLFRRLKAFRRIFSRFEKLDIMFVGFITFVLIVEALREGVKLC
jgi:transposase